MLFAEFLKNIREGKRESLYLFLGEEKYLSLEALHVLKTTILDPGSETFNYVEFSLTSDGLAATLNTAQQYPMFGSQRLVLVRNFEKLNETELDRLKEYLKNPSPTTTLVFQAEGLDKRRNISTVLLKSCTLVEFNRLKEREAIEWASNYLRTYGYQLSGNAASLLIGLTGTDLFTISNELDKLMTARATPGLISPTDIEALVIRSREHSNFELADAIVAGEKKRALRLLSRQLADKQEPVLILGMLARVLRQLLLAKQLMEQQFPASEIAREIGIPPFRIAEFLTQAKKWHSQQLLYFIKQVAAADNAIKSSLGKPQLQLEYLVCELLIKN